MNLPQTFKGHHMWPYTKAEYAQDVCSNRQPVKEHQGMYQLPLERGKNTYNGCLDWLFSMKNKKTRWTLSHPNPESLENPNLLSFLLLLPPPPPCLSGHKLVQRLVPSQLLFAPCFLRCGFLLARAACTHRFVRLRQRSRPHFWGMGASQALGLSVDRVGGGGGGYPSICIFRVVTQSCPVRNGTFSFFSNDSFRPGGMFARRATFLLTIPTSAPDLPSHGEAPQVDHIALHTFPTKHVAK